MQKLHNECWKCVKRPAAAFLTAQTFCWLFPEMPTLYSSSDASPLRLKHKPNCSLSGEPHIYSHPFPPSQLCLNVLTEMPKICQDHYKLIDCGQWSNIPPIERQLSYQNANFLNLNQYHFMPWSGIWKSVPSMLRRQSYHQSCLDLMSNKIQKGLMKDNHLRKT